MLKKINRLPKIFLKPEKQFKASFFDLKFAQNKKNISRFAFVVSKRIDKRATARNRIRRKFRRCIEENLGGIINGDFLFILKRNINEESYCQTLIEFLKKENFYYEKPINKIN